MELRLKGYGTIEITNATLVDGDDIMIEAADNFDSITDIIGCSVKEAYLVEVDFKWTLVVWLNIPVYMWDTDDVIVFQIENQDDIYRLNALL